MSSSDLLTQALAAAADARELRARLLLEQRLVLARCEDRMARSREQLRLTAELLVETARGSAGGAGRRDSSADPATAPTGASMPPQPRAGRCPPGRGGTPSLI